MTDDSVCADVELLRAMYPDEVTVDDEGVVRIPIAPQVGGNAKEQFISCVLQWRQGALTFDRCLGLSEHQTRALIDSVDASLGLFDAVQALVTLVTELNEQQCGDCPICLLPLASGDRFRLQRCFHTVHRKCMKEWWDGSEAQAPSCVVCRLPAEEEDLREITGQPVEENSEEKESAPAPGCDGPRTLRLRTEHNIDFSEEFRLMREALPESCTGGYYSKTHFGRLELPSGQEALRWLLKHNGTTVAGDRLIVSYDVDAMDGAEVVAKETPPRPR